MGVTSKTYPTTDSSVRTTIERNAALIGGRLQYIVNSRDETTWGQLEAAGRFRISWTSCTAPTTAGMKSRLDGGYVSGEVGLSRTRLSQEDD